MAGLYIHIPFCAKRCQYCDFFSNTDMKFKEPYIDAAIREMELRQEYIGGEPLDTISVSYTHLTLPTNSLV